MGEVKDIPKGWERVALNDIAEINPSLNKSQLADDMLFPFVPMPSVGAGDGRIDIATERLFSEVKKGYTPFQSGDVLFAKITPCMENGKIAVVPHLKDQYGFGSTEFHVIRPLAGTDSHYIFYFVSRQEFRNIAASKMTGAVGQKRVPTDFIKQALIPLPPLPEQHRIVARIEELFSDLDKGIESLKTAQQQLKIYRQAVLKWAFEGRLTGAAPVISKLGEHAELITKGASPRWQGFEYLYDDSQLLFITSENVRENFLDVTEPKYLSLEFNKIQKRSILKNGDVLFNLVGASIGRAAVFNLSRLTNINQAVAIIRLKDSLNNKYLSFYLNSAIAKHKYLEKIVDVARANLSLADVTSIEIPLFAVAEQHRIVSEIEDRLSVCDKMEESISQSLQQAEALRQSILKKAFEGKLVPQDPNDEPAGASLERIRAEKGLLKDQYKNKPGKKAKDKNVTT